MFELFKEIRKAGDATIGYPFQPLEMPAGFRGKPEHKERLCIACGACEKRCPFGVPISENMKQAAALFGA